MTVNLSFDHQKQLWGKNGRVQLVGRNDDDYEEFDESYVQERERLWKGFKTEAIVNFPMLGCDIEAKGRVRHLTVGSKSQFLAKEQLRECSKGKGTCMVPTCAD